MHVIRHGDLNSELHSVRSKKKAVSFEGSEQAASSKKGHSTCSATQVHILQENWVLPKGIHEETPSTSA